VVITRYNLTLLVLRLVLSISGLFDPLKANEGPLPPSLGIPDIFGITDESRIHLSSGINPRYIPDKSGMLDESGIYPGYIRDTSGIYPGYIWDTSTSQINLGYILNIS
jgi:hypothetical protein